MVEYPEKFTSPGKCVIVARFFCEFEILILFIAFAFQLHLVALMQINSLELSSVLSVTIFQVYVFCISDIFTEMKTIFLMFL